jgi:ubiquitin C-terminal hydrolase
LKITSVVRQPESMSLYPILGVSLVKVAVELDQTKALFKSNLKLNNGTSKYEGKTSSLVRKVGNQLKISELLQCFSEPEKLTEENSVFCSVCKDHKLADKTMELFKTPKLLIVHLKRFNHRGDSGNRYIIYG